MDRSQKLALVAQDLSRTYHGDVALEGVSFSVKPGTVLGLLGPNGAGKTTLMRILTTVLQPTRGAFVVDDQPYTEPLRVRGRIGVLPESSGYPEALTGREYLAFHARLHGRDGRTVASLLREVGLRDRADDAIRTYSRGMRQRLGIARSLVNEPSVVFLDEPTLGLDPAGQQHVLDLVRTMAKVRGVAVVYSTHFLEEVEAVCDEVIILNHGRVVLRGPLDALQDQAAEVRIDVRAGERERTLATLKAASLEARSEADRIYVTLGSAEISQVLSALADARIPVQHVSTCGGSLRDTFLRITEAAP